MKFNIPPGVFDIVPEDPKEPWRNSHLWQYVEETIRDIAHQYGFQEIRTPVFERTELFMRGVGETSDIVTKEMYTFDDKGGRSMTLRPEGTAPAMRAFIEHQMANQGSVHKLFYIEPMFRYERSQAGRYRQHHQFGAEAIGITSPEQDVELIDLLYTLYGRLGLKNLGVYLNSIGDVSSRTTFKLSLQEYLRGSYDQLSEDSQTRFETNPLRILDSKDPNDQKIIAKAPSILDFLNDECLEHFNSVKSLLDKLKIPYQVNPRLVRGLDYYNKTVFEIVAGELGAQNSIGGGGRYDGLLNTLGGPDLPAIGFGTGIERIIQTILKQEAPTPAPERPVLFIIPLGDEAKEACFPMLHDLRSRRVSAQMDFNAKKLNKAMQYANQIQARYVIVVGDNELLTKQVELKDMASGKTQKIPLLVIPSFLEQQKKNEEFSVLRNEMDKLLETPEEADFFIKQFEDTIHSAEKAISDLQSVLHDINKINKDSAN